MRSPQSQALPVPLRATRRAPSAPAHRVCQLERGRGPIAAIPPRSRLATPFGAASPDLGTLPQREGRTSEQTWGKRAVPACLPPARAVGLARRNWLGGSATADVPRAHNGEGTAEPVLWAACRCVARLGPVHRRRRASLAGLGRSLGRCRRIQAGRFRPASAWLAHALHTRFNLRDATRCAASRPFTHGTVRGSMLALAAVLGLAAMAAAAPAADEVTSLPGWDGPLPARVSWRRTEASANMQPERPAAGRLGPAACQRGHMQSRTCTVLHCSCAAEVADHRRLSAVVAVSSDSAADVEWLRDHRQRQEARPLLVHRGPHQPGHQARGPVVERR